MRLGLSSYAYAWAIGVPGYPPAQPMDACNLLRATHTLGVNLLQIADNLPLHTLEEAEIAELDRLARELGVAVKVGTRGMAPAHLFRYLDLSVQLGSPILRLIVDSQDDRPSVPEITQRVRELLPRLERDGITLAIENHDRLPTAALCEIIQACDSPWVGICLDTVNSFGALEGPERVVEALAPWTVNLHLKDFAVTRAQSQMGFSIEGSPAGEGRLDIPWLLERLRAEGRAPNAIIELWTPYGPDLAQTIAREADWARRSVSNMRPLIPA